MEPFREAVAASTRAIWSWHLFTWILGIAGIVFSANRLTGFYRRHERNEKIIRDSLEEKEMLLREIHHRVKNNLQVISGMLELQGVLVKDPSAKTALREGRNRVMSMALIHQKLYQSQDMAQVRMDSYIKSLVADLFSAYGVDDRKILMKVEAEAIRLDLDIAIPFGLLVGELVTNAIKYAFPPSREGEKAGILVSFREREEGDYILSVSDNGIGLPEGFDLDKASSLGLKLVHSLAEQLRGRVMLARGPGTAWTIICPPYLGAGDAVEPYLD